MPYDAFVSYSHAADGRLAPSLQGALQRFAKRWNRRRALRVFRDDTGLSVNTALWPSIETALEDSRYFILLASPDAVGSEWVNREIDRWLELGRKDRILPVLTEGEWVWDPVANDFDWARSSAVPPKLQGVFSEEPRHLDLRWAKSEASPEKLDLSNSEFRSAVADLAAPIHGKDKDALEGQDLSEFRKSRRYRRLATAALATLAVALGVAAIAAARSADEARRQERAAVEQAEIATSRQLAAQSVALAPAELDLSLLLALSAIEIDDSSSARGALLTSLEANPYLIAYVRGTEGSVTALAASSDSVLAIGESSGVVRVLDFSDLSENARIVLPEGEPVTSLAFSEAEDLVAIGTQAGDVALWRMSETAKTEPLAGPHPDAAVRALAFDSAGAQLAAVWSDRSNSGEYIDGTTIVWDLAPPASVRFGPSEAPIGAETLSFPDADNLMMFGAFDMERFDLNSGDVVESWSLQTGGAQSGPSAHASDGEIGAWSTLDRGDVGIYVPGPTSADSTDVAYIDVGGGANDLIKWDQTGSTLGLAKEGTITLFSSQGEELAFMAGAESAIADLAFDASSDRLASLGNNVVQVWDPNTRSRLASSPPFERADVPNVIKGVVDVDFSPDGSLVTWVNPNGFDGASTDPRGGGTVALWDLTSPELVTFTSSAIPCVVGFVGPDALATGNGGCDDSPAIEVWNAEGQPLLDQQTECIGGGPGSWASTQVFFTEAADTRLNSTTCANGELRAVDLNDAVASLGAAPGTTLAAVSRDGSAAAVLDRATGRLGAADLDDSGAVLSTRSVDLAGEIGLTGTPYVSPNGSTIVISASEPDPTQSTAGRLSATLWDADSGDQIGSIGPAAIDDLAFAPDGSLLAVALSGGDIELRDGVTLQLLTVLPGDGDAPIRLVEFSPNGSKLAEASSGGGLAVWNLDIATWARRACGIAGRDLRAEEISVFFGESKPVDPGCGGVTADSADVRPAAPLASVDRDGERTPEPASATAATVEAVPPTTTVVDLPQLTTPVELASLCSEFPLDHGSPEIRFEPGASSGSINDVVVPGTARQYVLKASADQVLDVSIDAEHLICVHDGLGFFEADVGAVVTVLPATGLFFITVVAIQESGRFTLEVAIPSA